MKTRMLTLLSAVVVLHLLPVHVHAAGRGPSLPNASEPASREDQSALWKTLEQLSFAAVEGADSVTRTVARHQVPLPGAGASGLAIGAGLQGTNVDVQLDPAGTLETVSFDLRGGCISTRTLLSQYPGLLVLHVPLHPQANPVLGTTIAGALVRFRMATESGPCVIGVAVQTVEMAKAQHWLN